MQTISFSRLAAGVAVVLAMFIAVSDPFGDEAISRASALTILIIGLWATGVMAEFKAALLFFTLAMLFAIAPADVTFAGFGAGATWLIFSGLVIGVGVHTSGLGKSIAVRLSSMFGGGYSRTIVGILIVTLVLGFIMPSSMGRVVLMMPIAIALAKEMEYEPNSRGYVGVTLAAGFGCFFMPYGILPANIPNVVLHGIVEEQFGFSLIYGEWFALHFPFLSVLKVFILWSLIMLLFPAKSKSDAEAKNIPPMSPIEWRLLLILMAAVVGWATDFIHQISPAWIGMLAAMLFMVPRLGNVTSADFAKINFSVLFYVAAILGLGALVNHSGLGSTMAEKLISVLPLGQNTFQDFMTISFTGMAIGTFTAAVGVPILLTPLAEPLVAGSGFSLKAILMMQALSFSTPYLVYQSAPIVVAMGMAGVRLVDGTKLIALLAVVTALVIFPLSFLWWQFLGWI
jgi:di/tricarboxylate transporter